MGLSMSHAWLWDGRQALRLRDHTCLRKDSGKQDPEKSHGTFSNSKALRMVPTLPPGPPSSCFLASVLPPSSSATSHSNHNGLHSRAFSHHWASGWNTLPRSLLCPVYCYSPLRYGQKCHLLQEAFLIATSPKMYSKGLLVPTAP